MPRRDENTPEWARGDVSQAATDARQRDTALSHEGVVESGCQLGRSAVQHPPDGRLAVFVGSAKQVCASTAPMPSAKAAGHRAPFMAKAATQADLGVVVDVLVTEQLPTLLLGELTQSLKLLGGRAVPCAVRAPGAAQDMGWSGRPLVPDTASEVQLGSAVDIAG